MPARAEAPVGPATAEPLQGVWRQWQQQLDEYEVLLKAPAAEEARRATALGTGLAAVAEAPGEAMAADPAVWQKLLRAATERLIERQARAVVRAPVEAALKEERDGPAALRRFLEAAAPRLAEAQAKIPGLSVEIDALREQVAAARAAVAPLSAVVQALAATGPETPLGELVAQLEAIAAGVLAAGYTERLDSLRRLGTHLRAEVLPLLSGAAASPGGEALRFYRETLASAVARLEQRLEEAATAAGRAEDGLAPLEDIDERLARLRARCRGLRERGESYRREQAQTLVQQHLRPLLDDFLREFVTPLLLEARGEECLVPVAEAVRETLAREDLQIVAQPAGAVIVPAPPTDGEAHVLAAECEETEVLPAAEGVRPGTVAALLEPGYRWAGEVIARARVRSYR